MPAPRRLAWYQTLRAYTVLLDIMDGELQAECGVPLAWYDVLIEISNAPGHAIRMNELADKVLLSRSWLTRRVAQLEREVGGAGAGGEAVLAHAGEDADHVLAGPQGADRGRGQVVKGGVTQGGQHDSLVFGRGPDVTGRELSACGELRRDCHMGSDTGRMTLHGAS